MARSWTSRSTASAGCGSTCVTLSHAGGTRGSTWAPTPPIRRRSGATGRRAPADRDSIQPESPLFPGRLGREQCAPALGVDLPVDELAGVRRDELQALVALLGALRRLLILHQLLGRLLLGDGGAGHCRDQRDGQTALEHLATGDVDGVAAIHFSTSS